MGCIGSCILAAVLFYFVGPFGVLAVICGLFAGGWFNELWDTTNGQSIQRGGVNAVLILIFMIPLALIASYLFTGDPSSQGYIEGGNSVIREGAEVIESFWDVGH